MRPVRHERRALGLLFTIALGCLAAASAPAATASATLGTTHGAAAAAEYLQLAEGGVEDARRRWRRGSWYVERLHDRDRYPLATIWGVVPLFEALDAIRTHGSLPTPAGSAFRNA